METVARIEFLVDGVNIGNFTGPQNAPILRHTPFFHVDGLSDTQEHMIVMNTLTSNLWYLDYVVYKTENSALAGGGGGGQRIGQTGGSPSSPNVGLIVGAVIAAVLGTVALLVIGFVLVRRCRARRERGGTGATAEVPPGLQIVPFDVANTRSQTSSNPKLRLVSGRSPPQPLSPTTTTSYLDGLTSSYSEDLSTASPLAESSNSGRQRQPVPVLRVVSHG